MTMRMFAAVLPPDQSSDELNRAVEGLRAGSTDLRWTERDGWHFTLAFMGEVEEALLPELTELLEQAAHRTETFPLRIQGAGQFAGTALWAGAAGGVDELRIFAERVNATVRRAGVKLDQHHPYQAHLTLARVTGRARMDLSPYVKALEDFAGTEWEVTDLALVRSNPPVNGVPSRQPRYEVIARAPLGGPRHVHAVSDR
ncbi:RNA 2',3'-cyclic phosphodiesterase [Streptomyces sp. NPDC088725]|uniref:RNA 2',3'-cyclic phosphodiesterase n=1 Tax=Streptomyces sp. NPDC088725 TaxID=3365873 RepID=UPI00381680CC